MTLVERLGGAAAAEPRPPSPAEPEAFGLGRRRLGIKRILPRTLFGRALMIILTPLLLMQAIALWVFYDRHWDSMSTRLSQGLAGEMWLLIEQMERVPEAEWPELFSLFGRTTQVIYSYEPGSEIAEIPYRFGYDVLRSQLSDALEDKVGRPFAIDPAVTDNWVEVQVQLPGGVLHAMSPMRRLFSDTSTIFILWMTGSAVALFTVAIIFMRNQIRPIRRLAHAADSFGKGRDVPEFKIEGASEVRQAAHAFLVMRERIRRQLTQRTDMLAGVSHDLRTPLTRMHLQLAMLGDGPEVDELKADVAEMGRMIEGYLAFARGEGKETPVTTDLAALLADVVGGARREGAVIALDLPEPVALPLRPQAFRRCLANLLSNARRHAEHVWMTAELRGKQVEIVIDDDGPGIPQDQIEHVFRPFYRIDASRNQDTGGTGLGLTIARDVARSHGGDIRLTRSPRGGLRCLIRLPV